MFFPTIKNAQIMKGIKVTDRLIVNSFTKMVNLTLFLLIFGFFGKFSFIFKKLKFKKTCVKYKIFF